jgi:hypothetical protein
LKPVFATTGHQLRFSEPGSSDRRRSVLAAAPAQVTNWHCRESLSRRIKSVRYLRDKRPIRTGSRAPIECLTTVSPIREDQTDFRSLVLLAFAATGGCWSSSTISWMKEGLELALGELVSGAPANEQKVRKAL